MGIFTDVPQGELTQVTLQQQGTTRLVTPKPVDFACHLAAERTRILRTADLAGALVGGTNTTPSNP
ncbi:MAG: hypothetical protein ACKOFW_03740, partial [Planctomycetaceae bacterium]